MENHASEPPTLTVALQLDFNTCTGVQSYVVEALREENPFGYLPGRQTKMLLSEERLADQCPGQYSRLSVSAGEKLYWLPRRGAGIHVVSGTARLSKFARIIHT
ncbi:hypothetical protein ACJQWK_05431 [Exserohilum turcicum]